MSIKHDYGRLLTFIVLLIVSSSTAIAQELMKVTGVVVDQNAEPLIGVTVRVKDDAKSGTVTGLDGDFSIMVQKGKTLVFSYLGYQTKEVAAITSKLKINMKEDNKMLDDVVVVGYGVQKKSSVTGAISQVKKEDMENRTITNAKSALQGKTAGVQDCLFFCSSGCITNHSYPWFLFQWFFRPTLCSRWCVPRRY